MTNGLKFDKRKIESLKELIKLLENNKYLEEFNGDAFKSIIEKIEVESRTSFIIHLRCGLILKEVLYE